MTIVCAGRHTRCRYGSVGLLKGLFVEKTFAFMWAFSRPGLF